MLVNLVIILYYILVNCNDIKCIDTFNKLSALTLKLSIFFLIDIISILINIFINVHHVYMLYYTTYNKRHIYFMKYPNS